jgi:type II secretory pathway predicted ATPase ExeA
MMDTPLSLKNMKHRNRIYNIHPLPRDTSEAYLLHLLTAALPGLSYSTITLAP